jgi:solute carrier family 25 carnitine/acylcarnitine transporter 20/29
MLLTGFLAGCLQTLIGHPFDTIKTQLQVNKPSSNYTYIKNTLKTQGYKSLYRGATFPLVSGIIMNIYLFSGFTYLNNYLNIPLSGFIVGGCSSVILCPTELMKCHLQTSSIKFIDIFNKLKIEKISVFKGLYLTFCRESIGCSTYFTTFHYLEEYSNYSALNGGVAGVCSWFLTYPIDTIKTQIQVYGKAKYTKLYKGFSFVFLRSFLVNSCIFYVYKNVNSTSIYDKVYN